MAVLIPNLYCNWYISGGPSSQTVQIGQPPQVAATCSKDVGYISSPASTGQIASNIMAVNSTASLPSISIGQSYPKAVYTPVHHCSACGH